MHRISSSNEIYTKGYTKHQLHTIEQLAHTTSNSSGTASNYANDLGVKTYNLRFIQTMEIPGYQNSKTLNSMMLTGIITNQITFQFLIMKKTLLKAGEHRIPNFVLFFST